MKFLKNLLLRNKTVELIVDTRPEFSSFSSYEAMCKEEGSITAVYAIVIFIFLLLFKLWLREGTTKELARKGETPTERETEEKIVHTSKATDGIFHYLNKLLILPFVPDSHESLVAMVFFLWFVMTIPMAITRYYEKRWAQELTAQQGILNVISSFAGCKSLNITAIAYTDTISSNPPDEPEKNSPEELDHIFKLHLAAGICWLTFGFLQIFRARSGWSVDSDMQKKVHRYFGRVVAFPSLLAHLYFVLRISLRNPVNQIFAIRAQYYTTLLDSLISATLGIWDMRQALNLEKKKDQISGEEKKRVGVLRNRHKLRMAFCYFQSIFGSGPIRLTAWLLWLFAKFLPLPLQMRVDRGVCQLAAGGKGQLMGSAQDCWVPVFLNLSLSNILILWIEWLYVSVPHSDGSFNSNDPVDGKIFMSKVRAVIPLTIALNVVVLIPKLEPIAKVLVVVFSIFTRMNSWWMLIGSEVAKQPDDAHTFKTFCHEKMQNLMFRDDLHPNSKQD